MVEMLSCIKDWEVEQAQLQHMMEGKELVKLVCKTFILMNDVTVV
jgi:hypothetical protein